MELIKERIDHEYSSGKSCVTLPPDQYDHLAKHFPCEIDVLHFWSTTVVENDNSCFGIFYCVVKCKEVLYFMIVWSSDDDREIRIEFDGVCGNGLQTAVVLGERADPEA